MVILERFELQLGAILRLELKPGIAAFICREVLVELGLEIVVNGGVAQRMFAVGTALGVHLQQPKINAQLDFLHASLPVNFLTTTWPG